MSREVIDLAMGKRRRITACSYGKSRAGKTRFAATWPRPLFLADKSEGGWETMRYMKEDAFYEPGRRPMVWSIGSHTEMQESLREVKAMIAKGTDEFFTLVVDSLTFYADTYFAALEVAAFNKSGGKAIDRRHLYQDLGSHLRFMMLDIHQLPINVLWLCLEKPAGEDGSDGGLLLAGQAAQKAPARCDNLFYHRTFRPSDAEPPVYEIRTRMFGSYNAGGRDEGALPDPLEPNYKSIEHHLQIMSPFAVGSRKIAAAK